MLRDLIKQILREATSDSTGARGSYVLPLQPGLRKFKKNELKPFTEELSEIDNAEKYWDSLDGNINENEEKINEDLAVWFGTKKKPKGSSQPKGPWVNICKKVDGKHPPCGRPEATDKAYPKCRAAGVAGKMSDSQKRAACNQKRRAEKSNPKPGTGNKPKMVSYKPRKK
jgi:hypothetical protein